MLTACIFTNTPDEHFVIDRLPDAPQVIVVSACSGHGYKFCSVVGEIAADLALDGATRHDIGLFQLRRFDQRD
jgi:sarcosine oxidase